MREEFSWVTEVSGRVVRSRTSWNVSCCDALCPKSLSNEKTVVWFACVRLSWLPSAQAIAIGYTFMVRRLWGGPANAEMKRLMIDHAFGFARTVWFEVGRDNLRSRRAMEKIGATLAGDRVDPPGSAAAPHVLFRIDRAARGG